MTVVPSPPKHIKEGIELLQESWTRHRGKCGHSVAQASQDCRVPWSDVEQVDVDVGPGQSSYLSQVSQIISVEKFGLSIKKIEQFVEFHQSLCRFCSKSVWRKICVEKILVEEK